MLYHEFDDWQSLALTMGLLLGFRLEDNDAKKHDAITFVFEHPLVPSQLKKHLQIRCDWQQYEPAIVEFWTFPEAVWGNSCPQSI